MWGGEGGRRGSNNVLSAVALSSFFFTWARNEYHLWHYDAFHTKSIIIISSGSGASPVSKWVSLGVQGSLTFNIGTVVKAGQV